MRAADARDARAQRNLRSPGRRAHTRGSSAGYWRRLNIGSDCIEWGFASPILQMRRNEGGIESSNNKGGNIHTVTYYKLVHLREIYSLFYGDLLQNILRNPGLGDANSARRIRLFEERLQHHPHLCNNNTFGHCKIIKAIKNGGQKKNFYKNFFRATIAPQGLGIYDINHSREVVCVTQAYSSRLVHVSSL